MLKRFLIGIISLVCGILVFYTFFLFGLPLTGLVSGQGIFFFYLLKLRTRYDSSDAS